jgi:hypothetical protein
MKKYFAGAPFTTIAFVATLLMAGCKKEDSTSLSAQEERQAATYSGESEIDSEIAFDDVYDNVMGVNTEVGLGGVGIFGRVASTTGRGSGLDSVPPCVTVTITPQQTGVFPKTVTLDFGQGCYSHNHLRSGKIKTVYSGPLREPGNSATTTFDNFKVDSVSVEGTHKITNTTASTSGSNQRQFKIDITAAKLTRPNGDYTEWTATRTQTQIEGNGTLLPTDDVLSVQGISHGRVKRASLIVLWNSEITEPLIKKYSCRWISKGRVRTIREGLPANTPWVNLLDYGTGVCDNQATLTINGNTQQITLH